MWCKSFPKKEFGKPSRLQFFGVSPENCAYIHVSLPVPLDRLSNLLVWSK